MPNAKHRSCALSSAIIAALALSGCDKPTINGQSQTIDLLKAGSEKACVATDVQKALHDTIVPKVTEVSGGKDDQAKLAAIKTVALSYADTTLASVDKAVSKVSCSTMVRISGPEGKSKRFAVTYSVSPSADNPNSFIVTGTTDEAHAYADDLINASLQAAADDQERQQQNAEAAQSKAKLLATLTPKWLVGVWIYTEGDSSDCATNSAFRFGADHSFESQMMTARWALNGDKIHLIGRSPSGPFDTNMDITEADALSFQYDGDEGPIKLRRCSRSETASAQDGADRSSL